MNSVRLRGTGVAMVTPFKENLEIDFDALGALMQYTYADGKGIDYWVVMGTTGEPATLSKEEKIKVLQFVKENNKAKLPIVYGIGGNDTQAVLKSIEETDFEGIDFLLSVSPYYNKPSQNGIFEHFRLIADKSPVPVILYNVPGRTASNISANTTLRLAEHKNIIGVKEASGDIVQCMQIAKYMPADFLLISGDDLMTLPMIPFGGSGAISVMANAFPKTFSKMVHSALENDYQTASENLNKLLEINPLMYEESNPVGVKQALNFKGICSNQVRLPLVTASEDLKNRLKNLINDID